MEFTIREKNPGPQLSVKKNGEPIIEAGIPQTPEQVAMAQGKAAAPKTK